MNILAIGVFGCIGGMLRLVIENSLHGPQGLPVATVTINLSGSFLLGFFLVMAERKGYRDWIRQGIGVGLLGALTTFSNFTLDTLQLLRTHGGLAAAYVALSLGGGLICVWFGEGLASRVFARPLPSALPDAGGYAYDTGQ
ncbi:MAG: CrcB family protein [Alicyclobacillus sp.]|nr:CrcB family protein [Alicyclobacillus sp.]